MDILSGDISDMVFKISIGEDLDEISVDGQMLGVLMELDGKKDLGTIARALNINMLSIRNAVSRLLDLSLVEQVEVSIPMMDKEIFDFLNTQLSFAIGPIAEVLIEEVLDEMGLNSNKIPKRRSAELLDLLAHRISREEKRIAFQQSMLNKIKEMRS